MRGDRFLPDDPRRRIALKLLWLAVLVLLLVVFSKAEHDFVYQAF